MSGLESEKNPLRINKQFYKPSHKKRSSYSRRKFPQSYNTQSPILDTPQPDSVIKYLRDIQSIKHINRQYCHNDLYFPDPEKDRKKIPNIYNTISLRKKSVSFLHPIQRKTIQTQRNNFLKTFRSKSQKKQQMNLTFYNTTTKSKFIMDKFHEDKHINQRSSPTFQNMLQRTIIIDDILSKVKISQRKFIHGY